MATWRTGTVNSLSASAGSTLTASRTITAGDLVVLCLTWEDSQTLSSVVDTAGGTWIIATQQAQGAAPAPIGAIAYCLSHPGGSTTITATLSGTANALLEMDVLCFTPASGKLFALDATMTPVTGASSASFTGTAISTTAAGVVVEFVAGFQLTTAVSAGGTPTFTRDTATENASGRSFAQYLLNSGAGSVTPGASWGAPAGKYVLLAVAFKEVTPTASDPNADIGAVGVRRNTPGRGPYSRNRGSQYFRRPAVITPQFFPYVEPPREIIVDWATARPRPGRGPYSLGRYFRPRVEAFGVAGPSVYNDTLIEAMGGADAAATVMTMANALGESGSAADALATLVTWAASLAEAGSASDALVNALVAVASLTEAASAADAVAGSTAGSTYNDTLTEAASAADALLAALVISLANSETGAAADALAVALTLAAALNEAGAASDSLASALTLVAALTEAAAAGDALASQIIVALSEAANAVDALTALVASQIALAESGAATDALSVSGGVASSSLTEVASALDSLAATIRRWIVQNDPAGSWSAQTSSGSWVKQPDPPGTWTV